MSKISENNKRIAQNTLYLYFRQIAVIAVGLYTSRIILKTLGVTDYGIYEAVGGTVGFLGFINGALASGASRFITYAIGEGDEKKAERTFITILTIHIILGIFIAVIMEVMGIWMIYNKFQFPTDRLSSAVWALHFSVLTTAIGVSQVPYSACLQAHERFDITAYAAIIDIFLRLVIAILIQYFGSDKLIFFALLLCIQNIGLMMFYRWFCSNRYKEAKFKLSFDKKIFHSIATFSTWGLIYNFVYSLNQQGTTILFGWFFSPTILAAKAISVKVNSMTTQFIGQFRAAANPQIVMNYAQTNYEEFRRLILMSAKYSFFIMWIMTLPICLLATPLLHLWLGEVPEYTVIFVQLIMIDSLFWLFDVSFNQGIIATGNVKQSTIYTCITNFMRFPIVYILFALGFSPISSFIVSIVFGAFIGLILKPCLLRQIIFFPWKDFIKIYAICIGVAGISALIPYYLTYLLDINTIIGFFVIGFTSIIIACITILYLGLERSHREKILHIIKNKINKYAITF